MQLDPVEKVAVKPFSNRNTQLINIQVKRSAALPVIFTSDPIQVSAGRDPRVHNDNQIHGLWLSVGSAPSSMSTCLSIPAPMMHSYHYQGFLQ